MAEYDYKVAAASRELAVLEGQADRLRTDLIKLRRDVTLSNRELANTKRELVAVQLELAPARRELVRLENESSNLLSQHSGLQAAELREANERLVLAALRAETSAEAAINHLNEVTQASQRDVLTDTPNRALMFDRLNNAITLARRNSTHIAVLFLDLDHFKQINDTLGHGIGDEVLQLVARRLEAVVRDSDTVSRHSGDEFLVLLTEVAQASDAALIAAKMLYALSAASHVGDHVLHLSTSIGIAIYPEDGEDAEVLISKADAAMYSSKRSGRSGFEFYREEIATDVESAMHLQEKITKAVYEKTVAIDGEPLAYLREANTQLIIAALTAQELEAKARIAHEQQLNIMATIAHELRNPLSPIRTAAGLLNHARMDESMHLRLQAIIERQVIHMSRLVDDLLDGSRLTTGKLRLEIQRLELVDILNAAVDTCRPAIDGRHQHLTFRRLTSSVNIQGDPIRLTQVFSNLLDNASKYTPDGGKLNILVDATDDAVAITISDNGIGITEAALPHIFELFVQDTYGLVLHNGGLGIGLAVVRNLVEAHQGTVTARSAGVDCGSEFVVTLPIA
jgi:diguanylate cyclase (GGDEF)-like protein